MSLLTDRLIVAGTHSGVGKTTVATGLMAAFSNRGVQVGSAKVGPDFIDPSFHQVATGRPGRNLDPWISGADSIGPLAGRAAEGVDMLVVEGVMGLFDGAVDGSLSSTADVAEMLNAPIILVVDGSSMSASVAALVRGFRDHRPSLHLAGVVLNRVGSPVHQQLLTEALHEIGVDVLGCLPRRSDLVWRDRHLGLVPVAENRGEVTESIQRLADVIEQHCDLTKIQKIAADVASRHHRPVRLSNPADPSVNVAVAAGPAFTFMYHDNIEALSAAGANLVSFDPLVDEQLPSDCAGLVVGGGFPEVYADRLSGNVELLADVRRRLNDGLVAWVECGGLLWLSNGVDGNQMVDAVKTTAAMTSKLTLGYREATVQTGNPLAPAGATLRGHEFHYSTTTPTGDALTLTSRFASRQEGFATPTLLATYLHQHLGDHPEPAKRFVDTCQTFGSRGRT